MLGHQLRELLANLAKDHLLEKKALRHKNKHL